ncbi:hypothetical protein vBEliSR6L_27 [Erythrobacter phage vB_EliS_R6L]|nr:hypothetical protein vBEliSR6L_27 [Erythrobacter phage vB_EliS_R6L]
MVRALLAGRKTQTRRLTTSPLAKALPGDRLWVREAWACHWATDDQAPRDIDPDLWSVRYLADDHISPAARDGSLALLDQCRKGRPSIFMPRWASRLTLTITDVRRTEPVDQISREDAIAEGIYQPNGPGWTHDVDAPDWWNDPVFAFRKLWDGLHDRPGERFTDAPTIVALTFRVALANIDASDQPHG